MISDCTAVNNRSARPGKTAPNSPKARISPADTKKTGGLTFIRGERAEGAASVRTGSLIYVSARLMRRPGSSWHYQRPSEPLVADPVHSDLGRIPEHKAPSQESCAEESG